MKATLNETSTSSLSELPMVGNPYFLFDRRLQKKEVATPKRAFLRSGQQDVDYPKYVLYEISSMRMPFRRFTK